MLQMQMDDMHVPHTCYMFIGVYMISAWATIDPYSDCISVCVCVRASACVLAA